MASDDEGKSKNSRRDLLLGLAAVAVVGGGWQAWVNRPKGLSFQPIDGLPGWRRVEFDGVSAPSSGLAGAAFIGIGNEVSTVAPMAPDRLCNTLFSDAAEGKVSVAAFSDFYCPYCRVLTQRLADRASAADSRIAVTWHELPLLGPASVIAAKAAVAADMQGGYAEFQARLMTTQFRPTVQFIADAAESVDLRPGQLLQDMDGQVVASRLRRSRAAGLTLGIWGTPALVVGRTLVIGEISDGNLDELIAIEAEAGPVTC